MLKEILQTTTAALRLAQDVAENRADIKDIRRELREVGTTVERLQLELRQVSEREERERQLMMLQLENMLLRRQHPRMLLPEASADEP